MITMRGVRRGVLTFILSAATCVSAAAQSSSDLAAGQQLFQGLCSRCHGIDGTGDEGPNLNRPNLHLAPDDAALRVIIRDGLPDLGMPRVRRLQDDEITALVVFVRSLGRTAPSVQAGNAENGSAVFQKLGCATCHIINGAGGSLGPELSGIGAHRSPKYLRGAVLEPGASLPKGVLPIPSRGFDEFLLVRIVTRDGKEVRGLRINEDSFTIQLKDTKNQFLSFRKSDVRQIEKEFGKSLMPGYRDRLTGSDIDDLVAYLSSLGGAK